MPSKFQQAAEWSDLLTERLATLTDRERECYQLMRDKLSTQAIAAKLGIERESAKTLRKKVRRKLGLLSP